MAEILDSSHTAPNALERIADCVLTKTQSCVDGIRVGAVDGTTLPVYDPTTNMHLADVVNLGHAETLHVVNTANAAWSAWRKLAGKERTGLMYHWFDLLIVNVDDLIALVIAEQSKPLTEVKGEIAYSASFIERLVEEVKHVSDDVMASTWRDKRMVVLKQPVGVYASVTPWNFPLTTITREAALAMAAGYAIVIKPAEQMPPSALAMTELAHHVGIPEGVVNIAMGDVDRSIVIGKALCESPIIHHLSSTGSTSVGHTLMQQCSSTVKRVALELGGHALFIVFDNVNTDATMEGTVQPKHRNAGQTCMYTNRFYVHTSVYGAFIEKLPVKVRGVEIGSGFELGVIQGPLIDDQAVEKVQRHVDDVTQKGVRLVAGDKLTQDLNSQRLVEPTVLADAMPDMLIIHRETFDPVSVILKFQDEAEVMHLVDDTKFGLASYFFSRDIGRIWRVAEQLGYSMVDINTGLIPNEVVLFGGVRQPGLGREGSVYSIDEYLELKHLCMDDI